MRRLTLAATSSSRPMQHRRRAATTEIVTPDFDSRIRATRCSCTAPCKEQAGNRDPSYAPILYTHRLVLRAYNGSGHAAPPSPALMLRSRALSVFTRVFHALWRGASKHEGTRRPILRDGASRLLRMRRLTRMRRSRHVAAPRSSPLFTCQTASLLRSRGAISAPGLLHPCFAKPRSRGGGAPRDVRVQRHPSGRAVSRHTRRLARRLASHDAAIYGAK